MKRPKIILTGHARHGKDTACNMMADWGYTWQSSSWLAGQIAVWPAIQDSMYHDGPDSPFRYQTFEEAFEDRAEHRAFWFEQIKAYNTPDETRLAREIFKTSDIYCGMRRFEELSACKDQKVCDFVIWIDASKRLPLEDKSSCTVQPMQAGYILDNNGTLLDLQIRVNKLMGGFIQPWVRRMNDNRCIHCGSNQLNDNQLANTVWCQACGKVQP